MCLAANAASVEEYATVAVLSSVVPGSLKSLKPVTFP